MKKLLVYNPPDLVHVVHEHVNPLEQLGLLLPEAEQPGGAEAGQHPAVLSQVLLPELPGAPGDKRALLCCVKTP